jgi:phosphate transport system ATP-binding protein
MDDVRLAERTVTATASKISAKKVQVFYDTNHAIKDVDVEILDKTVTAFIGPSGCGKSTFLRCLNRMNDTVASCRVEGKITMDGDL